MSSDDFVVGVIKWFNPTKGYGFAIYDGKDIFIHSKRLRESGFVVSMDPTKPIIDAGDKLRFKIEHGAKGAYAVQLSKVL